MCPSHEIADALLQPARVMRGLLRMLQYRRFNSVPRSSCRLRPRASGSFEVDAKACSPGARDKAAATVLLRSRHSKVSSSSMVTTTAKSKFRLSLFNGPKAVFPCCCRARSVVLITSPKMSPASATEIAAERVPSPTMMRLELAVELALGPKTGVDVGGLMLSPPDRRAAHHTELARRVGDGNVQPVWQQRVLRSRTSSRRWSHAPSRIKSV